MRREQHGGIAGVAILGAAVLLVVIAIPWCRWPPTMALPTALWAQQMCPQRGNNQKNGNFLPAVAEGGEEREKKGRKRGEREKGGGRSSSDGPRSRGLLNAQNSLKIVRVGVKKEGNPGGKPQK